jgi:hypothetical protein
MELEYAANAPSFTERFSTFLEAWLLAARAEQLARGYGPDFPQTLYQQYLDSWNLLLDIYQVSGFKAVWHHPDLEQERDAILAAYVKGVYQPIL